MKRICQLHFGLLLLSMVVAPNVRATSPDAADVSLRQFLAQDDSQHPYRATRRLEAANGPRTAWMEALTEYSPQKGFQYRITAEGGSGYVRGKVLRAVLDAERDIIAQGEAARSSLTPSNYIFQANGVDLDGLANVLLSPRRKERILIAGTMFLQPTDGGLVRLEGQLARSPSFWIKNVNIVRSYERMGGAVMPVALESTAELRLLGLASFRMTYVYSEVDGQPIGSTIAQRPVI